ncbi:MAG: hypothetical protein PWR10_1761 [Halanaerobiales bacterium]|nr:hypothetical protein [Halanaerobiales bacterium]
MNINWNIILTVLLALIPVLSVLIVILRKFFPGVDPYFRKGSVILAEVDDILDAILLEYPGNKYLNTVNDVIDKLLIELEEAGYKIDSEDKKKIENRAKAKIKKEEGASLKWEDGKLKLEFNKEF